MRTIAIAVALMIPGFGSTTWAAPRSHTIGKEAPLKLKAESPTPKGWEAPYGGVTPGGALAPPEQKAPPNGLQAITWPGFRILPEGGGSEVFLQLTGPVTFQEKRKGHRLLITLDKVVVPLRNNLRPVITTSFGRTPVDRFRLRLLGKDQVRLEISLKRKSTHSVALNAQGQYRYLVVWFPSVAPAK